MKRKKIPFDDIRKEILDMKENEGISLAQAVVDFADRNEIPLKKIKSYLDENLFQLLKAELKSNNKKYYFTEFIEN